MFRHTILLLALTGVSASASADSLPIKPGLWESTITSTNPFSGTQKTTHRECSKQDNWDPQAMMQENSECTVTKSKLSGNTLDFAMTCNIEGGQGLIEGSYTTDGDTGSGAMTINMSFGGQNMKMENSFESKRIGDC